MATNVVASLPPEQRPTATAIVCANFCLKIIKNVAFQNKFEIPNWYGKSYSVTSLLNLKIGITRLNYHLMKALENRCSHFLSEFISNFKWNIKYYQIPGKHCFCFSLQMSNYSQSVKYWINWNLKLKMF